MTYAKSMGEDRAVVVVPYSASWLDRFEEERSRIAKVLAAFSPAIEHILFAPLTRGFMHSGYNPYQLAKPAKPGLCTMKP